MDMASERRHGPGQRLANSTFRQFLASMVAKYGDSALEGMEKLCKVPARQAVCPLNPVRSYPLC